MNSTVLTRLKEAGNDIDSYLSRFDNDEETCEMLSLMYIDDTNCNSYLDAYEQQDFVACRGFIHNVKGAASNVGLSLLSKKALEIMHAIDNSDFVKLPVLNEELKEIYASTMAILSTQT